MMIIKNYIKYHLLALNSENQKTNFISYIGKELKKPL